ncbi:MAG: Fur family transcriptional regulator [Acidimicrobiia bacterium]
MPEHAATLRTTVAARLRRENQRFTTKRSVLVDVLADAPGPLTIPEILDVRPELAQSSVYRNLLVLEQAGVVHRILTNGEFARYELAEDLTEHHHHLICASCGAVEDVPASAGLEAAVHQVVEEVRRQAGFRTHQHRVDLVGRCRRCS